MHNASLYNETPGISKRYLWAVVCLKPWQQAPFYKRYVFILIRHVLRDLKNIQLAHSIFCSDIYLEQLNSKVNEADYVQPRRWCNTRLTY